MTFDPFASVTDNLIAPARDLFAIDPSDTIALPKATKALYIGSGGDIALRTTGSDADVVLRNVLTGTVLAVRVEAIRSTGTTAGDLVGFA